MTFAPLLALCLACSAAPASPLDQRSTPSLIHHPPLSDLELKAKSGDAAVAHELGDRYSEGRDGAPRDEVQAAAWYSKAASLGDRDAKADLADYFLNGKGGLSPDASRAFSLYLEAAQAGHGFACHMVAWMCELGRGTSPDASKAFQWYQKAADLGQVEAVTELGRMTELGLGTSKDEAAAARLYAVAVRGGSPQAMTSLGWYFLQGKGGLAPDPASARQLFELASSLGNARADGNLGYIYENGLGVPRNLSTAIQKFQLSADAGDLLSQRHLARLFAYGGSAVTDLQKALHYHCLAVLQGADEDILALPFVLQGPTRLPPDEAATLRAYLQADLQQGHTRSRLPLALFDLYGFSPDHGAESAKALLLAEAEQPCIPKLFMAIVRSLRMVSGQGSHAALSRAVMERLLQKDIPGAKLQAALFLLDEPKPASSRGAAKLQELAQAGDSRASYELGLLYQNGRVLPQSSAKALASFTRAAAAGEAEAMYHLGVLYQIGFFGKRNPAEAIRWYRQADQKGWPPAHGRVLADGTLAPLTP